MGLVLAGYFLSAALLQAPQKGARMVAEAAEAHAEHAEPEGDHKAKEDTDHGPAPETEPEAHGDHEAEDASHVGTQLHPDYWMVIPFVLLLGAIAVLPLIPATEHWWESNLHRFYVAAVLAVLTLFYYLFLHAGPIEAHWPVHDLVSHT